MKTLKQYLSAIDSVLAKGDATEHTHRPSFEALIESLRTGITDITLREADRLLSIVGPLATAYRTEPAVLATMKAERPPRELLNSATVA